MQRAMVDGPKPSRVARDRSHLLHGAAKLVDHRVVDRERVRELAVIPKAPIAAAAEPPPQRFAVLSQIGDDRPRVVELVASRDELHLARRGLQVLEILELALFPRRFDRFYAI